MKGEFLKLTIAGWGKTENSESKSDVLMKAVVDYLPHDNCAEKFKDLRKIHSMIKVDIEDTHLCAGGIKKVDT